MALCRRHSRHRGAGDTGHIVLAFMLGMLAIRVFVALLLSVGAGRRPVQGARHRSTRAHDVGHYGRFGRYILGAELALDHPLGIGPLQFSTLLPRGIPHNSFLNAFMAGGWLAGFAYLTLSARDARCWACASCSYARRGSRSITRSTPPIVGAVVESVIIDIDHWRHYFLILGVLWGLMAALAALLAAAPAVARARPLRARA